MIVATGKSSLDSELIRPIWRGGFEGVLCEIPFWVPEKKQKQIDATVKLVV